MRKLYVAGCSLAALLLLLWSVSIGLDIESKIHYIRIRQQTQGGVITLSGAAFTEINPALKSDPETSPVPPPAGHPPLDIIVGSHTFHVVYASHDWMIRSGKLAATDESGLRIILDRQRNAIEIREDVLHELMHAAYWEAGGKPSYAERLTEQDQFIKPTAPVMRDILADNPKLVKWLVQNGG